MEMKKVALITLYSNNNIGNKLQNYAVQQFIKKLGDYEIVTIKNKPYLRLKDRLYILMKTDYKRIIKEKKRLRSFKKFDSFIKKTKYSVVTTNPKKINNNFDYYIVGSDQVWNPNFNYPINRIKKLYLLNFTNDNEKKISISASFGVSELSELVRKQVIDDLSKFKSLSVRELSGKKIIEELTKRKDVEVLLDPTMLIEDKEWDLVSKKPTKDVNEKFILNYFLGNLSQDKRNQINDFARKNGCQVINMLDKKDPFYTCGPSEFLWLEKNAFLICTDSFHSSVFAILFKRPFVVFNRDDGQKGINSMNSRIENLLTKFNLDNKYYIDRMNKHFLTCDYTHVDTILKNEREKAKKYLLNALDDNTKK